MIIIINIKVKQILIINIFFVFLFSGLIAEFEAISDNEPVRFGSDSEAPVFTEELTDQV